VGDQRADHRHQLPLTSRTDQHSPGPP
jgi:hypothetical protein